MFHQQRDLEEKLNKKFEELKNLNKVETSDSNESSKTIESKEDPKIKTHETEIEGKTDANGSRRRYKKKAFLVILD